MSSITSLEHFDITPFARLNEWDSDDAFWMGGSMVGGGPWTFGYGSTIYPRGATGTTNDRRGGKNLPLQWTKLDLRGFEILSRWVSETNPEGIGILAKIVGYLCGKGFGAQAVKKGVKKKKGSPDKDSLVDRAQDILDGWRRDNRWGTQSREAVRRWRRDGNMFGRLEEPEDARGLPVWQFLEPSQIDDPQGNTTGPDSFGIRWDRLRRPISYHLCTLDQTPDQGDWVDAREIVHAKANVDGLVKWGLPDFFPVAAHLELVLKIIRNMGGSVGKMSAVAWREQFAYATQEVAASMIPQRVPATVYQPLVGFQGSLTSSPLDSNGSNRFEPGEVVRTEGSRQFVDGPTAAGAASFIEVTRATLAFVKSRFGMSDEDDKSFAQALVDGGPFVVLTVGLQTEWAEVEQDIARRVLDAAVDAGQLSPGEREDLDVEVPLPTVATPNPGAETTRRAVLFDKKALSLTTWQLEEGLDPDQEQANQLAEAEHVAKLLAMQPQQPEGPDGEDGGGGAPTPAPPGSAGGDGSGGA